MAVDEVVIAQVVRHPSAYADLVASGITTEFFVGDFQKVWNYVSRIYKEHGKMPSERQLTHRFKWLDLPQTRRRDFTIQVAELRKRHEHTEFVTLLREAADMLGDPEDIDEVRSYVLRSVNALSVKNGKSSLRDLFSDEISAQLIGEIRKRRSADNIGYPTGLTKFDLVCGGLQKQRLIATIGRSGIGKTWLNLLFVREMVMAGAKVILYPLEMTLPETAFRLYTLFSNRVSGTDKAIKNTDLAMGRASMKKVVKLLNLLENRYAGQLYVADVGSINDPYTMERVEAEVSIHQPDVWWIDYITLMHMDNSNKNRDDILIRELAKNAKGCAQRTYTVGGISAQVNRDSLKGNFFLPRLEHISFGDALGHPCDQVFSFNRKGKYLYYGVVKNRHGPEISKTRTKFFPNSGDIHEMRDDFDEREG